MSLLVAVLAGCLAGAVLTLVAGGGRRRHAELEHQAFHDGLTGLANRALFMDRLDHALKRRTGNVAVLYLDLDGFKPVNDTYGHEAGDGVLAAVAERMRGSLRAADTAARLGGDEFAVLLVDIPEEHVGGVADRLRDLFAVPFELETCKVRLSASVGVATALSGAATADGLLRDADAAMYAAKRGMGRVAAFAPLAG